MSDAVLVALISAFGLIGTALVGVLFQNVKLGRRIDRVHDKAEVVRDQVQNSHGTNLRDDLDRLAATVRDGFQDVARRQDLAASARITDRSETRAVDARVDALGQRLDQHIDGTTDRPEA